MKPCAPWCPQPMVPTPGIRPIQFAARMKMKMLAKNQNVRPAKWVPMIPTMNLYKPSTSHSRKFCAPLGINSIFLVATCANTIKPAATIQLTIIELVIGKLNGRAISTAFVERPWLSASELKFSTSLSDAATVVVGVVAQRDVVQVSVTSKSTNTTSNGVLPVNACGSNFQFASQASYMLTADFMLTASVWPHQVCRQDWYLRPSDSQPG